MSNVKYVYKSQWKVIDALIHNCKDAVTSGAVFDALQSLKKDTLFETGYIAEGISGVEQPFAIYLSPVDALTGTTTLTIAANSMIFVPDGIHELDGGEQRLKFKAYKLNVELESTSAGVYPYSTVVMVKVNDNGASYTMIHKIPRQYKGDAATGTFDVDDEYQNIYVSDTAPLGVDDGAVWWDSSTNYMKVREDNEWHVQDLSLPLALIRGKARQVGNQLVSYATEITETYGTAGYLGNAIWLNPGAHLVFPNGRITTDSMYNVYSTVEKISGLRENGDLKDPTDMTYDEASPEVQGVICKFVNLTEYAETIQEQGGLRDVYKTLYNKSFYLTQDMNIIGPIDDIPFNESTGYYEEFDSEGIVRRSYCKFAAISTGVLRQEEGADWFRRHNYVTDPALVTSFIAREPLTIVDSDAIDYVIRLIGSSNGETIDSLDLKITDLLARINAIYNTDDDGNPTGFVKDLVDSTRDDLYINVHNSTVHKKLPADFNQADWAVNLWQPESSENALREEVLGPKIFKETATFEQGMNGIASHLDIDWYYEADQSPVADRPGMMFLAGVPMKYNEADGTLITNTRPNPDENVTNANGYGKYDRINLGVNTNIRIDRNTVYAEYFNGTATRAQWADLAELYEADADYEVGTLVRFGGDKEITLANFGVANAVVSEKPGFLLNSGMEHGTPIALVGRVKVRVLGPIKKGDAIVLNPATPGVAMAVEGTPEGIIGRALETNELVGEKLVLCVTKFSL